MKNGLCFPIGCYVELNKSTNPKEIQNWDEKALIDDQRVLSAWISYKIISHATGTEFIQYNGKRIK